MTTDKIGAALTEAEVEYPEEIERLRSLLYAAGLEPERPRRLYAAARYLVARGVRVIATHEEAAP
jgi:hypothetical protein